MNGHLELLRQQTILARFGELALKSDDLDEILTEACRLVGEALGTDLAKVMQIEADGATLLVRAGVGWHPGVVGTVRVELSERSSEGHALKTGKPMISADIATETRVSYPSFLTDHGVKAVANVAIIGGKGKAPFGILQIDSRSPRAFTDDDTAFLSGYANLIAAAVERLSVMAALRASVRRQEAALETGLIGFFEWDVPAATVTADKYFAAFYGLDPACLQAGVPLATLADLVHPDDRASTAGNVCAAIAAGSDYVDELRLVHADGTTHWLHVRGRCTEWEGEQQGEYQGGRPRRYTGTAVEITAAKATEEALRRSNDLLEARVGERTRELSEANARLRAEAAEREQVEEALRQSQKMEAVGQLTGGIAHDFNNMLQAIGGSLELMGRRVEQGRADEALRLAGSARATVERAAALTHRLLAFARRQTLQPRMIDPDELVGGLIELIERMVGPAVRVEVAPRNGVWHVLCDPNQLENVLLNLAINARDAMPEGGTLRISTGDVRLSAADIAGQHGAASGDYVEIVVADSGVGMDEATRLRAFEPFFTTKPIGQGTGLGLSQLYGFAKQSGGAVRLDSAPGRGTTVRLFLPRHAVAESADAPAATRNEPDIAAAGAVVLLVEDEAEVRHVAAERLRERGSQVLEASSGPDALAVLQDTRRQVDVLVTDVGLPGGLNGRQVADAARLTRPTLPVLFITGYAGSLLQGRLAPGMAVIGKPFTLDALVATVGGMLEPGPDQTDPA